MNPVRSLLLTDLVDSTRLADTLGDDAAAALGAAHDRIARDLLQSWRGREIDKTDGMLMLFEQPADAVGCALDYHRALAALDPPLVARAGLHVGPVVLRDNPPADVARGAKPIEVEGVSKSIAARVMSLAAGGQTLLTAEARQALGTVSRRVESHGHWRVKGVAEPFELFEIGDASAVFAPPADGQKGYRVVMRGDLWLPVRELRHSLPAERDVFVGRSEPLAELARRFDGGARLVSLLGMGGTGKTRLATRFGWSWLGDFPGGVWFCDLSQARGVDGIVHAVAQGLDVPLGKDDPVVQLGHAIAGRGPCLMVLDNFEQVARHAEDTLGRWLDRAADARFLVTTREVLGLPGEHALALAPLAAADAATLFTRRAASAAHDFRPGSEDAAAIEQLVRLLDGLPLAIELAAARVRVLPPKALLARMDQRFRLLTAFGGRQDRQATLRTTFDWSWDLLSGPERAAFAQLSVFEGGFTLEAVEAVLDLSGAASAPWTPDVLQSLVDKSFVRPLADGRFELLSSLQDYAAEHLRTPDRFPGSGPAMLQATQARHGAWFAGLGPSPQQVESGIDLDNVVVATRRAVLRGEVTVAVAGLERAWIALRLRGPFRVGAELAAQVRSMPGLDVEGLARVELVAGAAWRATGDAAASAVCLEKALALARDCGHAGAAARAGSLLGDLFAIAGRMDEARAALDDALPVARELGDHALECEILNALGGVAEYRGDLALARHHHEDALRLARQAGNRYWECGTLGNIGQLDANQGDMASARTAFEAALAVARELGHRTWEGNELCNLGLLHHAAGRNDLAREHLERALVVARELGHARLESIVLCNLGLVCESEQRVGEAQSHFEAALAMARRLGDLRSEGQFLTYLGLLQARQGLFAPARTSLEAARALLIGVADRLSLGILVCGQAEVAWRAGDVDDARRAFAEAKSLAVELDAGVTSELGVALEKVRCSLELSP